MMSNKTYDTLKTVALIVVPVLAFIAALVNIWEGNVVVEAGTALQGSVIDAPQWMEVQANGVAEDATLTNWGYAQVWGEINNATVQIAAAAVILYRR